MVQIAALFIEKWAQSFTSSKLLLPSFLAPCILPTLACLELVGQIRHLVQSRFFVRRGVPFLSDCHYPADRRNKILILSGIVHKKHYLCYEFLHLAPKKR